MADAERGWAYGGICYVVVSFALWVLVEYITAWNSKLGEWVTVSVSPPGNSIQRTGGAVRDGGLEVMWLMMRE